MRSSPIGILIAVLGVVVALCAWLFPFQPIRPSPFDKTSNSSPVEHSRDQAQNLNVEPNRLLGGGAPKQGKMSAEVTRDSSGGSTPTDLNGKWRLLDTVESTSYSPYANIQLVFRVSVTQVGSKFTAEGEKYSLNGRELSYSERTAIHITGSIEDENIVATFVEDGTKRGSAGTFTWKIEGGGSKLRGRFVSSAARSSGESIMTKEQ